MEEEEEGEEGEEEEVLGEEGEVVTVSPDCPRHQKIQTEDDGETLAR